jgi:hypothetical protein
MAFVLLPDVTAAEADDGLVLLDQRNGRYWQLNGTGAATLRLLLDGYSPEAAAARLAREFPEASERAHADVRALLDALLNAHLVTTQ